MKMRGKFHINRDHYHSEKSNLIYAKNRVKGRVLQHLEICLELQFITSFTTINDLFNFRKYTFSQFHQKEHVMKKFRELKKGASLFSDFYFEFI